MGELSYKSCALCKFKRRIEDTANRRLMEICGKMEDDFLCWTQAESQLYVCDAFLPRNGSLIKNNHNFRKVE